MNFKQMGFNIFAVHLFRNCSQHLTGHRIECLCLASFLKGLNNCSLDGHNVGAYMPFRPSVGNRDIPRHQIVYLIVRTLAHIKYLLSILPFFGRNAVFPGTDITFLLIFFARIQSWHIILIVQFSVKGSFYNYIFVLLHGWNPLGASTNRFLLK